MKIKLTESQYKRIVLREQNLKDLRTGYLGNAQGKVAGGSDGGNWAYGEEPIISQDDTPLHHFYLPLASIVAAFVPGGQLVSTGLEVADCGLYYSEGEKEKAAWACAFALLPGAISMATKIPGVKELGKKGMAVLGKKLFNMSKGGKESLSSLEKELATAMVKEKSALIKAGSKRLKGAKSDLRKFKGIGGIKNAFEKGEPLIVHRYIAYSPEQGGMNLKGAFANTKSKESMRIYHFMVGKKYYQGGDDKFSHLYSATLKPKKVKYRTNTTTFDKSDIDALRKEGYDAIVVHPQFEKTIYDPAYLDLDRASDIISLHPPQAGGILDNVKYVGKPGGSKSSENIKNVESVIPQKRVKVTESQYKKVLLREFGETVTDPKQWYLRVLEWVDSSKDLDFETNEYEVVAYDNKGSYLGYYDKDQGFGFVVTEYGIGLEDEENIEEQEEGGQTSAAGAMTKWEDIVSPVRGPDNTLDNSPWSVSPVRGPDNTLDNSPWSVSPVRGPDNQLT